MKKILFFISTAIMLAVVSCNKADMNNQQTAPSGTPIEFVAYTEVETKTTLNGLSTEWEEDDLIDINGVCYIATTNGAKTLFTFEDGDGYPEPPYEVGYPYASVYNNADSDGKLSFRFSNNHQLVKEDIGDNVLAVAYSESEPSLQFKNVVALLKFVVPEFTEEITEIRISTTEPLAGQIVVDCNDATWTPDEDGVTYNEVVLESSSGFEAGATYYVPVLPGEKTNLTLRINGYLAAQGKKLTCKRNVIHNLGTLPAPIASDVKVKVGSTRYTTYVEGDYSVVRNIKLGSTTTYKIVSAKSEELRGIASTTPLNSWCNLYKANGNMSGLNGTFDIYVYKSKSAVCIVNAGATVPQYSYENQTLYFMYQDTNWQGLYAWNGSDYLLGVWNECGSNRKGTFTTPDGKTCSYWELPSRANNKKINLIVRNGAYNLQSVDTPITLTGDTESWEASWDTGANKANIGTYTMVPYKF